MARDVTPVVPVHDGHCCDPHVALTITRMDGEVKGRHLRTQRELAGFSIRALAAAAGVSPTRVRQLEDAPHVTPGATTKYLDGIAEAWRRRASEATRGEDV
jgi:helix-turn-helix protein